MPRRTASIQHAPASNAPERAPRGGVPLTLRARKPGYSVMQKCLEIQAAAGPRTPWQRFRGADPLVPEARSWFKGAQGELLVARQLEMLGPEYTVLHAVPIGAGEGDVDHIVVGPTGVFSINTKNHADRKVWVGGWSLYVEGQKKQHIVKSHREGERATAMLSAAADGPVLVRPLLVIEAAALRYGKKEPAVVVLRPNEVGRWINALPQVHSPEAVTFLSMIAEERGTWHVEAVVLNDTLRHVQRFERLERDIAEAFRRRGFLRRALAVGVLALPSGWLLGHWWGIAMLALRG